MDTTQRQWVTVNKDCASMYTPSLPSASPGTTTRTDTTCTSACQGCRSQDLSLCPDDDDYSTHYDHKTQHDNHLTPVLPIELDPLPCSTQVKGSTWAVVILRIYACSGRSLTIDWIHFVVVVIIFGIY